MHSQRWVREELNRNQSNEPIASLDQAETDSRRVEKFAELMRSVWTSKNDYERRARAVRLFMLITAHCSYPFVSRRSFYTHFLRSSKSGLLASSLARTRMRRNSLLPLQLTNIRPNALG
jgi:hypothetical protein